MAVPPKRPAIAGSRSNGRRIDHRPARGGMRVYGAFPSLLRPDWWARATTHRPVSSRPGGHRPPPTARFRPDLVATGHHPPPGFVPTWWLPATTHRPVSSRPGGYRPPPTARFHPDLVATDHHPPPSFFPTWWPGPPPTVQFLPDLVAQATTATPYRNQLHLSAVLADSGTPFRNSRAVPATDAK